jgi:catechol 2,3-dioxygenase-like lactoylglutathione lyase family enzyme
MLTTLFKAIDHIVLAALDLDASRAEFEHLGFQVTPRERHMRYGTANHLIILEDSYIELLGVAELSPPDRATLQILGPAFAAGNGLPMLALSTENPEAAHAALNAEGYPVTEPVTWSRDANTPDGLRTASFTTFFIGDTLLPDMTAFVCVHHTPQFVRHPAWQVHPNGASRLIGIDRPTAHGAGADYRFGPHRLAYRAPADANACILSLSTDQPLPEPRGIELKTVANVRIRLVNSPPGIAQKPRPLHQYLGT